MKTNSVHSIKWRPFRVRFSSWEYKWILYALQWNTEKRDSKKQNTSGKSSSFFFWLWAIIILIFFFSRAYTYMMFSNMQYRISTTFIAIVLYVWWARVSQSWLKLIWKLVPREIIHCLGPSCLKHLFYWHFTKKWWTTQKQRGSFYLQLVSILKRVPFFL